MKSEPASGASPASGRATEASSRSRRSRTGDKKAADKAFVEVVLEPQTWRHAGWAGFHVVAGAVLIYGLGAVGKGVGIALLFLGAIRGYKFVRAVLKPAGRIRVGVDPVELPAKLSVERADTVAVDDVRQVFFLRRALPWTQASPVLVIETDEQIYSYPRDWFASDSDQRRVVRALAEQIGRGLDPSLLGESGSEAPDKTNRTQVGITAFITAIVLFVAALVPATQDVFKSINLPVVVLYIGAALSLGVAMWHLIGLPDYDDD